MAVQNGLDKKLHHPVAEYPRMVSDTDVDLIESLLKNQRQKPKIIEFGPWLGGLSQILAGYGDLHVVDRFIWSDSNAETYPAIAKTGDNIRGLFERNMQISGHGVTVHETSFRHFSWSDGPVDFCVLDGPRKPNDLLHCLTPIAASLSKDARVLIKNGLNRAHLELLCLIEIFLGKGIFKWVPGDQPAWCNIAVLQPGPNIADLVDIGQPDALLASTPLAIGIADPWGGAMLSVARIAQRISAQDWSGAYALLAQLPPSIDNIYAWDDFEIQLTNSQEPDPQLAAFSEVMSVHNDQTAAQQNGVGFEKGEIWALRAYWANNADKPWRCSNLNPEMIAAAYAQTGLLRPAALAEKIKGKHVVEMGADLGLSGVGYLIAGAKSYVGIETHSLTAAMLQAEHRCDAITYLPAESFETGTLKNVDFFITSPAHAAQEQQVRIIDSVKTMLENTDCFVEMAELEKRPGGSPP